MIFNKPHFIFLLLFALLLLAPFWLSDGMFLDGVFYSCIARNLSEGIGTYWEPCFSLVNDRIFHSHPPLQFWLMSWFYKLFGTSIYVERLFACLIFIGTVWLIGLNASVLCNKKEPKALAYFAILLWLITPVVFWGYRHSILDTTMTMFCLAASYFLIKPKEKQYILDYLLAALFFIFALLTKGIAALFLLGIPVIWIILYRRHRLKVFIYYCLIFVVIPLIFFLVLFKTVPSARVYFDNYLAKQVFASLANENEVTVNHPGSILVKLLSELIVPIALVLLLFFLNRLSPIKIKSSSKEALLFLFVGLSATLPYLVSLKQHRMYLLAAIPFFILALVHFYQDYFKYIYEKFEKAYAAMLRKVNMVLGFLLVPAFIIALFMPLRDKDRLEDVYNLVGTVEPQTILGTSHTVAQRWEFSAYMNRLGYLYLDPHKEHELRLIDRQEGLPDNCKVVSQSTRYTICR